MGRGAQGHDAPQPAPHRGSHPAEFRPCYVPVQASVSFCVPKRCCCHQASYLCFGGNLIPRAHRTAIPMCGSTWDGNGVWGMLRVVAWHCPAVWGTPCPHGTLWGCRTPHPCQWVEKGVWGQRGGLAMTLLSAIRARPQWGVPAPGPHQALLGPCNGDGHGHTLPGANITITQGEMGLLEPLRARGPCPVPWGCFSGNAERASPTRKSIHALRYSRSCSQGWEMQWDPSH